MANFINYLAITILSLGLLYYLFALKYYCFPSNKKVYFRKFIFREIKMSLIKLAVVMVFFITTDKSNILSIAVTTLAITVFILSIINDNLVVRADDYLYISAFKIHKSSIKHYEVEENGDKSTIEIFYSLLTRKLSNKEQKRLKQLDAIQRKKAEQKGISSEERKRFITQKLTLPNAEVKNLLSNL
ncbi:MAG: hypothetical protein ACRC7N_08765 [Clostridium sp.]